METSPVGVVVFDAQSATPVSYNREARRIAEALPLRDGTTEDLLEVLTSRLADGREVTLDDLKNADSLRAAEVELSLSDGRTLRMLINVTPIRSGDGEVESVVVTMQDVAPFEELERLRTEFLGMVGHELHAACRHQGHGGDAARGIEAARRARDAGVSPHHRLGALDLEPPACEPVPVPVAGTWGRFSTLPLGVGSHSVDDCLRDPFVPGPRPQHQPSVVPQFERDPGRHHPVRPANGLYGASGATTAATPQPSLSRVDW